MTTNEFVAQALANLQREGYTATILVLYHLKDFVSHADSTHKNCKYTAQDAGWVSSQIWLAFSSRATIRDSDGSWISFASKGHLPEIPWGHKEGTMSAQEALQQLETWLQRLGYSYAIVVGNKISDGVPASIYTRLQLVETNEVDSVHIYGDLQRELWSHWSRCNHH